MLTDDLLEKLDQMSFSETEIDHMLDLRETPAFDGEWIRVYDSLEALKNNSAAYSGGKDPSEKVRETAFLKLYSLTQSDEAAGYVSDDFGLIYDSEVLGYSDRWLDKLINCYNQSRFPCGEL